MRNVLSIVLTNECTHEQELLLTGLLMNMGDRLN